MKKKILLFVYLAGAFVLNAQIGIGINTQLPQGVFHVDPKGDTSGNTNSSDDVIINNDGNMGIGTLNPTTKLHIVADAPNGNYGIRLEDSNTGNDKMLVSDANGYATWADQPQSKVQVINIIPSSPITYRFTSRDLLSAMQVTETGNYLISIRWWGDHKGSNAYFWLTEGATSSANLGGEPIRDCIEYYTGVIDNRVCFTVNLFAAATAGNYLKIYIQADDWTIGSVGLNPVWCPSIVLFKI